jgi:hypothetical protein
MSEAGKNHGWPKKLDFATPLCKVAVTINRVLIEIHYRQLLQAFRSGSLAMLYKTERVHSLRTPEKTGTGSRPCTKITGKTIQ